MAYRRTSVWPGSPPVSKPRLSDTSHTHAEYMSSKWRDVHSPLSNKTTEDMDWLDSSSNDSFNRSSTGLALSSRLRKSDHFTPASSATSPWTEPLQSQQGKRSPSTLLSLLNISESLSAVALPSSKTAMPSYITFPSFHSSPTLSAAETRPSELSISSGLRVGLFNDHKTVYERRSSSCTFTEEVVQKRPDNNHLSNVSFNGSTSFETLSTCSSQLKRRIATDVLEDKNEKGKSEGESFASQNGKLHCIAESKTRDGRKICQKLACFCVGLLLLVLPSCISLLQFYSSDTAVKCSETFKIEELVRDLHLLVHGQQPAVKIISSALQEFLSPREQLHSNLLVMSFHGWTGIGKNHVSNLIAKRLPERSVQRLIFPHHFPHSTSEEAESLYEWIATNVTKNCDDIHLLIVDDVDKAGKELLQSLHHSLHDLSQQLKQLSDNNPKDYDEVLGTTTIKPSECDDKTDAGSISDVDQSSNEERRVKKVIVLLLSNTGEMAINAHVMSSNIAFSDKEIEGHSYVVDELRKSLIGSWATDFLKDQLIDYIVPFLPLERRHVAECVESAFRARGRKASGGEVDGVLDRLSYYTRDDGVMFSTAGCSNVHIQVDLYLDG